MVVQAVTGGPFVMAAWRVATDRRSAGMRLRAQAWTQKCSASGAMSSQRSASEGTRIGSTVGDGGEVESFRIGTSQGVILETLASRTSRVRAPACA